MPIASYSADHTDREARRAENSRFGAAPSRRAALVGGIAFAAAATLGATPALASASALDPGLAVGQMAALAIHDAPVPVPQVPFTTADGTETTLAGFQGEALLVNFWATWCAPCLKEMPSIDALAGLMNAAETPVPFRVVAISLDRGGPGRPQAFLEKIAAKHLALYTEPTMRIAREMQAHGLPVTMLIDADGRELARLTGHTDWASDEAVAVATALTEIGGR